MNRRAWQTLRVAVIRSQRFRCATPACLGVDPLDVVPVPHKHDVWKGYCRSCRLKLDGPARARKGAATRLARRLAQVSLAPGAMPPPARPGNARGLGPPFCPACGAHDARLAPGAGAVRCVECGETWTGSADELADAEAQERRRRRRGRSLVVRHLERGGAEAEP